MLGDIKKKSKSQALRAVLFKYWEHDHKGFENPDEHYEHYMDKLINFVKTKLPKE